MALYSYTAKDSNSKKIKGQSEADTPSDLSKHLRSKGLYLLDCKRMAGRNEEFYQFKAIELVEFNRQLAAMLSSGISLIRTLNIMMQSDLKKGVLNTYRNIYRELQQGILFSDALEHQEGSFPDIMVQMYRAGEASGSLEKIAEKLANHFTKEHKMKSKIQGATTYPIILLCLTVVIMLIIFTFVLPQFFTMFDEIDTELPGITKAVMAISHFLTGNFLMVGVLAVIAGVAIAVIVNIPSVKLKIDRTKLHLPKIGYLMKIIYTARFARTLSSMYSSGLSMLRALDVTTGTVGNTYIASQFTKVSGKVRNGAPLSSAISEVDGFDKKLVSTIYIGEESGRLDEMLDSIADNFDYESEQATDKMITLIEPIMIVTMAVVIGVVMMAVMVPLYTMYSAMG